MSKRTTEAQNGPAPAFEVNRREAAEAQLEALRSAVREIADSLEWPTAEWAETCMVAGRMLRAALDGTPPVQDAPPVAVVSGARPSVEWVKPDGVPCSSCGAQRVAGVQPHFIGCEVWRRELDEAARRPPVEGDYPADPVTQQWAGIVEGLTKERDELRRLNDNQAETIRHYSQERDELRAELAKTDEDHERQMAERLARHREVVAEKNRVIADLQREVANLRVMGRVPK